MGENTALTQKEKKLNNMFRLRINRFRTIIEEVRTWTDIFNWNVLPMVLKTLAAVQKSLIEIKNWEVLLGITCKKFAKSVSGYIG